MPARSQAAIAAAAAEETSRALGARQDPEAPGGPKLVHVSRFETGSRRRETEIDRLVRAGVLDARHEAAAARWIAFVAAGEPSGRDSVDALSASMGSGDPSARHRAQHRLVSARMKASDLRRDLAAQIGAQGVAVIVDVCEGRSAAAIAVGLHFTRKGRPGDCGASSERGAAEKVHGLIRFAFDALANAVLDDRRPPLRFGERVDLGETRTEIEIVYAAPDPQP